MIEFTGPESARYQPHFLSYLAAGITDTNTDIQQASCYGAGVAAIHGGPAYLSFCTESLPHLFSIINVPKSRNEEKVLVTENAISAVGKICRAFKDTGAFDANQVISLWFHSLPIVEDEVEASEVYTFLLDLIDANHPAVVSTDAKHLSKLVHIITQVLIRPSLLESNPSVNQRLVKSLSSILSQCDPNTRSSLWNGLGAETQSFITSKGYI